MISRSTGYSKADMQCVHASCSNHAKECHAQHAS